MAILVRLIRSVALALAMALTLPVLAGAQWINPTAEAVQEQQLLTRTERIAGDCSIPDQKACTLEQLHGRDWTWFNESPMRLIGGGAILALIALVAAIYLVRGTAYIEHGRSGRMMLIFSAFERFVHWLTASCFFILALTGLNITFGKLLLLPLIGPAAFSTISRWGTYAHNSFSFPFTIGVLLMIPIWIHWNIPNRVDIQWMLEGGGFVGKKHPPADRFNAGQKSIYWVVVLGGMIAAATGYLLMFPYDGTEIAGMQLAQLVHGLVGLLYVAAMVFHVYMATIGEEGAFESIWDGVADENWAKQNHSVWYERQVAAGKVPKMPINGKRQRSPDRTLQSASE
jgi:formate dehydrogenase subunit gamma